MSYIRLLLWGVLLIGVTPAALLAHRPGSEATDAAPAVHVPDGLYAEVWFEPQLFSLLFTIWAIYLLGIGPMRAKLQPGEVFPLRHFLLFTSGLAAYYLAVASSLDEIGETYLFAAHMLQHNIMTYFVPLLILFGIPIWLADGVLEIAWVRKFVGFFTSPLVAFGAFNLALIVWHVPAMFEWALRDQFMHDLEHATFTLTALAMWWPIYGRSAKHLPPLRHYGLQMLYIFGLAVLTTPILTFLCFAPEPHYPTYINAPRITALSPFEDQFIGGVIMKGSAVVVYIGSWAHIFFRWAKESASPTEPIPMPVR